MPSFREIKSRVGGVRNIQQITRAMKMVAAARLRRSEDAIRSLRPYSSRLDHMCARFLHGAIGTEHPFFQEREVRSVGVLSIASDRGLCGAYNNRVVEATTRLLAERPGVESRTIAVGTRGMIGLRRAGLQLHDTFEDVFNPVHYITAQEIRQEFTDLFLREEVDEVQVVFTEFFSPLRQQVVTRRLMPCPPQVHRREIREHHTRKLPAGMHAEPESIERAEKLVYLYEPDYGTICDRLIEHNLSVQIYRALLEAQASEHGARMVAMDNATENAEEMIEHLTLQMNRLRQESITREILDVVGGAEAMK
ncbi:MAG: ATP synthase F1 subunit gamma [Candidatus Brocadiia bacterium]